MWVIYVYVVITFKHSIRVKSGFSILPKDKLTSGLKEPGIEPPNILLADNQLHL